MKHSDARANLEPEQIGLEVRRLVEAFFHGPKVAPDFPEKIEKLAAEIARWGTKTNLTAHPDDPDEIAFHVIDSLAPVVQASSGLPSQAFGKGRSILDLGSGAGFPGLVLAAPSDATFTLIEVRRKRASFLQIAAAAMQLRNVTIERRRAEVVVIESQYDIVTARAFGSATDFYLLAAKALKSSGLAILYASPSQPLSPEFAHRTGFTNYRRLEYDVQRRDEKVPRILAVWTRA